MHLYTFDIILLAIPCYFYALAWAVAWHSGRAGKKEGKEAMSGNPMDSGAPFEKIVRKSEVCSDECYDIYMQEDEEQLTETETLYGVKIP